MATIDTGRGSKSYKNTWRSAATAKRSLELEHTQYVKIILTMLLAIVQNSIVSLSYVVRSAVHGIDVAMYIQYAHHFNNLKAGRFVRTRIKNWMQFLTFNLTGCNSCYFVLKLHQKRSQKA